MAEYDNTNRGSIWKNEKKETEKHPDFTGPLDVDGVKYWISAWKKKPDAKEGAPVLSFSIRKGENQNGKSVANTDEDIPF